MLPGGGALGFADGAEYELVDDDVQPGQTYYYFVRGLPLLPRLRAGAQVYRR